MELRGFRHPGLARALTEPGAEQRGSGKWGAAALAALAGLTALRLAVAALAPLSPDEAYYWVWSRALAPGYLDHPPMVALWIRVGTALAGQGASGIRLLAPLAAALGSLLLAYAAADLLPGEVAARRRAGWLAAALLNATLLFGVGAVTMTPDTPLLFFWTAGLWAMGRLLRSGNGAWWLAAGAMAGLAIASKYTGLLFPAAVGLWLLATPAGRAWLRRPHPWAGAGLAAVPVVPVLLWNARHGWASLVKQGGRTGDWQPAAAPRYLGELLAGQIGLATPLVFLLCLAGAVLACRRALRPQAPPGWGLLAIVTVLPAAVFLQHALGDRVQANWPAILYPSAAIAAAGLAGRWARLAGPAVALGLAITAVVYLQSAAAPLPLPRRLDPTLMRLAGWPGLAAEVEAARVAAGARYVVADNYGEAAELARLLPPGVPVIGAEPRWALFRLPSAAGLAGSPGLLLRSSRRDPPDPADWPGLTPAGSAQRSRDGLLAESYRLYRVTAPGRPAVLLPRP